MSTDHGFGYQRSPKWPEVQKAYLAKYPACAACSSKTRKGPVQVHHIYPFHFCIALGRPDLELDERNFITLCEDEHNKPGEDHHLLIGHLDNFQSFNRDVIVDATQTYHGLTADQIRASKQWQAKVAKRPKSLDAMSEADKKVLRAELDKRFPPK
ncbi:MAG: HNH endonuclease [Rhodocyclaceae bacterium]|nr:MAG: HNH endonuclease [Rhodocyclaceae bacterium]